MCVCVCMHVLFGTLLVWVSGNVACVRWVVFVVIVSYACLCMVCVCMHVLFGNASSCVHSAGVGQW